MNRYGTVAGVLGIFAKLIAKLEKIREKQSKKEDKLIEQAAKLEHEATLARQEIHAADDAIAKLSQFLPAEKTEVS